MGAKHDTVSSVGGGQCLRDMVRLGELYIFVALAYYFGNNWSKLKKIINRQ